MTTCERVRAYLDNDELEKVSAEILVKAYGDAVFDNDTEAVHEIEQELLKRLREVEK